MKIVELINSITIPITNEESDLLSKLANESVSKSDLDLREREVASSLVNKGLVIRKNVDGQIKYYNRSRN